MSVLIAILGGTAGAAFVTGIFSLIKWRLDRKASREDRNADKEDKTNEQIAGIVVGVRMLMYDRIKHLGNSYLRRGSVSSEELEDLISMHKVYHNELDGNGFLDNLMEKVKHLPVKN